VSTSDQQRDEVAPFVFHEVNIRRDDGLIAIGPKFDAAIFE